MQCRSHYQSHHSGLLPKKFPLLNPSKTVSSTGSQNDFCFLLPSPELLTVIILSKSMLLLLPRQPFFDMDSPVFTFRTNHPNCVFFIVQPALDKKNFSSLHSFSSCAFAVVLVAPKLAGALLNCLKPL